MLKKTVFENLLKSIDLTRQKGNVRGTSEGKQEPREVSGADTALTQRQTPNSVNVNVSVDGHMGPEGRS